MYQLEKLFSDLDIRPLIINKMIMRFLDKILAWIFVFLYFVYFI